jgi:hypothetical protein
MSISYSFADGFLKYEVSGDYVFQEVYPVINQSLKDNRFKYGMNFLIDVTQSEAKRTTEEAYEFVDFLSLKYEFKGSKIAVVTPRPVPYGLARMTSVYLDEFDICLEVFRDLAEAEQWLKNK